MSAVPPKRVLRIRCRDMVMSMRGLVKAVDDGDDAEALTKALGINRASDALIEDLKHRIGGEVGDAGGMR